MTKSELKQKLEAVRIEVSTKYVWHSKECEVMDTFSSHETTFNAGVDSLLPLLLDAYEALELALSFCPKGPVPEGLSPEFYHTLDYLEELKLQEHINESRATLARIEAFATQGAHEQSEFENGEK